MNLLSAGDECTQYHWLFISYILPRSGAPTPCSPSNVCGSAIGVAVARLVGLRLVDRRKRTQPPLNHRGRQVVETAKELDSIFFLRSVTDLILPPEILVPSDLLNYVISDYDC